MSDAIREALQELVDAITPDKHGYHNASTSALARAKAALSAPKIAAQPVAWMRDDGEDGSISTMTVCISEKVKALWLKANPKQVERYTIPLFAPTVNVASQEPASPSLGDAPAFWIDPEALRGAYAKNEVIYVQTHEVPGHVPLYLGNPPAPSLEVPPLREDER